MAWVVVFGAIAVGGSLLAYLRARSTASWTAELRLPQVSGGESGQPATH